MVGVHFYVSGLFIIILNNKNTVKKIQKFPKTDTDNVVYSGSTMTTVVDKIIDSFDAGEWS
jgi:hypothetical protein